MTQLPVEELISELNAVQDVLKTTVDRAARRLAIIHNPTQGIFGDPEQIHTLHEVVNDNAVAWMRVDLLIRLLKKEE